jgi:hypothetical protein
VHNTIKNLLHFISDLQVLIVLLFFAPRQNNKDPLPSFTLTTNKKCLLFSQIRNYNKQPSTEIEANNYDKLLVENVKNQVVSIEFLCTLKYN